MEILGLSITRARPRATRPRSSTYLAAPLTPPANRTIIREPYTGAWQRNEEITTDSVLAMPAVFACVKLISSDIAKLGLRLVELNADRIWIETESPAFSPVLRKPNRYQNRIKFIEQWIISKLVHGNAYVLKERDARGVVVAMYVLDPARVTPLVATDGAVYYELRRDDLAGVQPSETLPATIVPAREIIHDVMIPLFHPLIGVSPIFACGLAAVQGLAIQTNSNRFFANGSRPGGVLTAPGAISDETAARVKAFWETEFSGEKIGKVAVLGDGLKYEATAITAIDAQLIEQLKWTAETVCMCFNVPPYKLSLGSPPSYNNAETWNLEYYSECLQSLIEALELSLDEGLELKSSPAGNPYGTEFDLDDLLRMDTPTKVKAAADGIGSGAMAPNEARYRYLNLGKVTGGETPYLQQQNYSLEALARRDAADPFAKPAPAPQPVEEEESEEAEELARFAAGLRKKLLEVPANA